jgi:hypothetical protein
VQGRLRHRAWLTFRPWDRQEIEAQLARGQDACCPRCGALLEAQPGTRMSAVMRRVRGFDLDCRACRRFHPVLRHTPESIISLRFRRLAAAVKRA